MKRYLFRIITLVCVKMMIPSFLFAGTVFNANAQKITLVYEQVELHKILEEVKRLTSYDFIYKPENIDGGKKVSLDIREENLEPALKKIFDPMGISMRIESQVIMLHIVLNMTEEETAFVLEQLKLAREQAIDYKNMKQISAIFEIYKTKCEQYFNEHGRNWRQMFKEYVNKRNAEKKAQGKK